MQVARTTDELRHAAGSLRAQAGTLGLVPTMGALHAGHLALLNASRREGGAVAASIFVNPTQFAANEDLARYPRDEAGDLAKLAQAGCDLVWLPDVASIYPDGDATVIEPGGPALGFEGDARPGHFRGVATVVAKLFGAVRPNHAVFGEKDWQQLQVIRRMAADLFLPVRIVGAPVIRDADGLAMSSRNRFLTEAERVRAPLLHRCLTEAANALARGDSAARVLPAQREILNAQGFGTEYFALVDGPTLRVRDGAAQRGDRLIAAARLGSVRLLDNLPVFGA